MKRMWDVLMLLGAVALLPTLAGAGTAFQQFHLDGFGGQIQQFEMRRFVWFPRRCRA